MKTKLLTFALVLALVLGVGGFGHVAHGAIAPDASSSAKDETGSVSTLTWSHTTAANAVLGVGFIHDDFRTVTSVTYNGVAMTLGKKQVDAGTTGFDAEIYYMLTPASGAHNIVITMSGVTNIDAMAQSFTGGDTTSIGTSAGTTQSPGSTISTNITTTRANSYLFDTVLSQSLAVSLTPGGTQTIVATCDIAAGVPDMCSSYDLKAALGATSMSWTAGSARVVAHAVLEFMSPAPVSNRKMRGIGVSR